MSRQSLDQKERHPQRSTLYNTTVNSTFAEPYAVVRSAPFALLWMQKFKTWKQAGHKSPLDDGFDQRAATDGDARLRTLCHDQHRAGVGHEDAVVITKLHGK